MEIQITSSIPNVFSQHWIMWNEDLRSSLELIFMSDRQPNKVGLLPIKRILPHTQKAIKIIISII